MSDIQVKRKTSVTVTETFTVDGAPIDLDSGVPTVVATAPDGTTTNPTASGTWTGRTTGQYRVVLAGQPEVTWRDLTWTGTIGGQPQTLEGRVEWLGVDLFTLAGFRELRVAGGQPFKSATYTNAMIQETRAQVLEEMQQVLGFPPVERLQRETHSVGYGGQVLVGQLQAVRVLSVTVAGVAQTAGNYQFDGVKLVPVTNYAVTPWGSYGIRNVIVEYVAGWPRVMGRGSNIAMIWAASILDPGISASASTISTPDGSSYSFDPAGQITRTGRVRHTGIAPVDAWLDRWGSPQIAVA